MAKSSGAKTVETPVVDTPGKLCPNCGEERVRPIRGKNMVFPVYDDAPHKNVFDCIRFLAKELNRAKSEIETLQSNIRSLERGDHGEGL